VACAMTGELREKYAHASDPADAAETAKPN